KEKIDFDSQIDKIAVKKSDKFYLIKLKDVVYLEYSDNRINVFTKDEKYYMNMTMKVFEEKSGPAFIRTHKAVLLFYCFFSATLFYLGFFFS
ncbi:MAG: LytTR family transcriptional regulator, partial [Tissierellales bacterium]|nr:LytTR family transcriptional regulator [Tissierellales bacterium]